MLRLHMCSRGEDQILQITETFIPLAEVSLFWSMMTTLYNPSFPGPWALFVFKILLEKVLRIVVTWFFMFSEKSKFE